MERGADGVQWVDQDGLPAPSPLAERLSEDLLDDLTLVDSRGLSIQWLTRQALASRVRSRSGGVRTTCTIIPIPPFAGFGH
jgi:hypothetical protein